MFATIIALHLVGILIPGPASDAQNLVVEMQRHGLGIDVVRKILLFSSKRIRSMDDLLALYEDPEQVRLRALQEKVCGDRADVTYRLATLMSIKVCGQL